MGINDKGHFQEERDKTDKSLEQERGKTDNYLDQKSKQLEHQTSDKIRLSRRNADFNREIKRAEVDSDKAEERLEMTGQQTSKIDDRSLIEERKRSDKAQNIERLTEDRARATERFQKSLIAAALLESERQNTDTSLFEERVSIDLGTQENFNLLSGEKISHGLTKAALITRDQFLAVVSHDLKNPLCAVLLSANMLRKSFLKNPSDIEAHLERMDIIERNAAIMDRLITDLLDVERMALDKLILKRENCDLKAVLKECVDLFAPIVETKLIAMTTQVSDEPMIACVDHDRLLQVLSNLIGNALKFTPAGGAIKLFAQRKEDEIVISVTDTGVGVPEEKKLEIFEKFSQLRTHDRRGLGLGLYISKWIVEAHQGHIWVTSKNGKGSSFSFTLPVVDVHINTVPPAPESPTPWQYPVV